MAPSEVLLGGEAGGGDDDIAALDSMGFTGANNSQYGMSTVAMSSGDVGGSQTSQGGGPAGSQSGGPSDSLFDRIKARTAEQQMGTMSAQSSNVSQPPSQQAAEREEPLPLQGAPSAFVSQQASSEPSREGQAFDRDFNAAVADAGAQPLPGSGAPAENETTYSFGAGAGEDFSFEPTPLRVPQYGKSRDDPYYAAIGNNQQYPTSMQDKASVALAQTGETMKQLFAAGVTGAKAVGAMAQERMAAGGGGGHTNSFLLGEGGAEGGVGMGSATMGPPPAESVSVPSGGETSAAASGQAYSMLSYGKTFCQDLYGFFMQLPPWGKGVAGVVVLWLLYALFG